MLVYSDVSLDYSRPEGIMAGKNDVQDSITVEDGRLIINMAIDTKGTKSTSGKSVIHFSTRGQVVLPNGMSLGVNLYSKA